MHSSIDQLRELAPWHFDIILGDVGTLDGNRAKFGPARETWPIGIVDPKELEPLILSLYPKGLKGKRFLDVACNGGGYSIVAKQLGADYALGFDAREHWIDQAKFCAAALGIEGIDFKVDGAHTFSSEEQFDLTLFKGIFYHLADPVSVMRRIADATREIIIVDTATGGGERGDLRMTFKAEDRQANLMTGVELIAWWPSGPDLIAELLKRMGFPATREVYWKRKQTRAGFGGGRCRVVAARSNQILADYDASGGNQKVGNLKLNEARLHSHADAPRKLKPPRAQS